MKKISFVFVIIFVSLFTTLYTLHTKYVNAQIPPPKVPCLEDEFRNPEFNSLRPYQASPCGDSQKAIMCGNAITIYEEVSETTNDCDAEYLEVNEVIDKTYTVYLKDAELPILGNTELTTNSTNASDQLDSAQKLNEYVSWYLEGANQKAEYGVDDINDTVNFSGPIKKLMPSVMQDLQRFRVLHAAGVKDDYTDSEGEGVKVDIDPNEEGIQVDETEQHSQIVACTTKNLFGIKNLWLGTEMPIPCYDGGDKANGKQWRLVQWWEGKATGLGKSLGLLEDENGNFWDGSDRWGYATPPFPWQFKEEILYKKAYQEWRGKECVLLFGKLGCVDIRIDGFVDIHTNAWADLYQYIPLGNTVDKNAKPMITNTVNPHPVGQSTITQNSATLILEEPALFFAHTQDVVETSEFLNSSFIPLEGTDTKVDYTTTETENDETGQCRVLNVRSNPGDNLFGEFEPNSYQVYVNYTINTIPCDKSCTRRVNKFGEEVFINRCQGGGRITISTITKTPGAKEIFENTTAGSSSTFRRIFPKVEEGAPVSCIANIPGETDMYYEGYETDGLSMEGGGSPKEIQVNIPDGTKTNGPAKLFFPHLGSVYEYFLKGIQTALRPKGYGEPLTDGRCGDLTCGELPDTLPDAAGSCAIGSHSSRISDIPNNLRWIIEAAAQTYKTPPDLILAVMYGEGLFNPGRLSWTESNVADWATCKPIPGCNPTGEDNFMGFNGNVFNNIVPKILPDLKNLDPNRMPPSQCNLLDSIYAIAYDLHNNADGGGGLPLTCFGINLQGNVPSSCNWSRENFASAIKVHESGYTDMCFTKENSCFTGGGVDAACPVGDTCETVSNRYANPSHFACLWDVAHGQ